MPPYTIESVKTQYYLTTQGAHPGAAVTTANGKEGIPPQAIIELSPPLHGPVNTCTIHGPNHLYVALPGGAGGGAKLIWSDKEYQWIIRETGSGTYVITPANGEDLYWIDKFGTGPVYLVEPGASVQPPENEFKITPLHR